MGNIEEFRKYIKRSFKEACDINHFTESQSNYELNLGNVTDKNHIFSIENRYYLHDYIMCKCQNCGLPCSFNLNKDDQIIVFNQITLTCDEIIIKNIIE